MRLHFIHNFNKWETVRRDVAEFNNAMFITYLTQVRYCKKCQKAEIKISDIDNQIKWRYE